MDAHTLYPADYVARGIARLQRNGTRWVSGPQAPKGHGPVFARRFPWRSARSSAAAGHANGVAVASPRGDEYELDATGVFGGVWERATLLEYGGWDERSSKPRRGFRAGGEVHGAR